MQLLYRPRDLNMALEQVLALVGAHTRASHVFMAENSRDGQSAEITTEWLNAGITSRRADIKSFSYVEFPSLVKYMEARGVLCVSDQSPLAPDLSNLLTTWGIHTFVAIPVYGKDRMYGFIAYDDMILRETWELEEQDLLRSISRAVSSAVSRQQVEEEEHSQRILAEVLRDITSVLNSTLSFKEMLDYILFNLERVIPHQAANIGLVNDQNQMVIETAQGYPPDILRIIDHLKIPTDKWNTIARVSMASQPVLISDVCEDQGWVSVPGLNWTRSYIGAAIRSRGKLLGILNVDSPIPGFFASEHAERVQAFADHAAIALENSRLFRETQRRADQMTTLYQIGLTLTQGLEMEEVLTTLHYQCRQVLENDVFYVAIYDEKTKMIDHPLFYEAGHYQTIPSRDLTVQPGLSGEVILNRKTIHIADTLDPEVAQAFQIIRSGGSPARSYVGVPLVAHDQVIGVISMQSYSPFVYKEEQVRLLETIANQAAVAIENARIFKQMKQLAITDSLTGAFTRWHFTALGQVELERSVRYNRPLAVLMMDIDNFKNFNDTFGHNIGDQVIQAVARMCRKGLRSSDIIGRYGGDEFAIILPETTLEGALQTAEQIRSLIETVEVETQGKVTHVTSSLGLAIFDGKNMTLDDLLICADRALYSAKHMGRNCIKVYEGGRAQIEQSLTRVSTPEEK